ncbi:M23 family metallopeptidase, partial [bacterium]
KLFALEERLSDIKVSHYGYINYIKYLAEKPARAFYLAAIGGFIGLTFAVSWPLVVKGAVVGLLIPLLYKVTEEFFGREIKQNVLKARETKQLLQGDENLRELTRKYGAELEKVSKRIKIAYYLPKAIAVFLRINLPVLSGIFTFARSRLAIAIVSGIVSQAVLPLLFFPETASKSVLEFAALASLLIPYANALHLPHTISGLIGIAILVLGIKITGIGEYRNIAQDIYAKKELGLKAFTLDALEGRDGEDKRELAAYLRGRPGQRYAMTGRYSVPFAAQLRYYLAFDLLALGVILTSWLSPVVLFLNRRYFGNPYIEVLYRNARFYSSFGNMSIIGAEIGAVVDSSYAFSQHPVLGLIGEPIYRAVEALELKALGWGHQLIAVTEQELGFSFSQALYEGLGGSQDMGRWWQEERRFEGLRAMISHKMIEALFGPASAEAAMPPEPASALPHLVPPIAGVLNVPAGGEYGAVRDRNGNGKHNDEPGHTGVDLLGTKGITEVRSILGGKVVLAEERKEGYGNIVEIEHSGAQPPYRTRYAHLERIYANKGDSVFAGQPIGTVGNSGNAHHTAPHLHFEVLVNGKPVDPASYLFSAGQPAASQSGVTEDKKEAVKATEAAKTLNAVSQSIDLQKLNPDRANDFAGLVKAARAAFTEAKELAKSGLDYFTYAYQAAKEDLEIKQMFLRLSDELGADQSKGHFAWNPYSKETIWFAREQAVFDGIANKEIVAEISGRRYTGKSAVELLKRVDAYGRGEYKFWKQGADGAEQELHTLKQVVAQGKIIFFKFNDPNVLAPEKLNSLSEAELLSYSGALRMYYTSDSEKKAEIKTLKDALAAFKGGSIQEVTAGVLSAQDALVEAKEDYARLQNLLKLIEALKRKPHLLANPDYESKGAVDNLKQWPGEDLVKAVKEGKLEIEYADFGKRIALGSGSPEPEIRKFLFSKPYKEGDFIARIDGEETAFIQQLENKGQVAQFDRLSGRRVWPQYTKEGILAHFDDGKSEMLAAGEISTYVLPKGVNAAKITHLGEAITKGGLELVSGERAASIEKDNAQSSLDSAKRFEALAMKLAYATVLDENGRIVYYLAGKELLDNEGNFKDARLAYNRQTKAFRVIDDKAKAPSLSNPDEELLSNLEDVSRVVKGRVIYGEEVVVAQKEGSYQWYAKATVPQGEQLVLGKGKLVGIEVDTEYRINKAYQTTDEFDQQKIIHMRTQDGKFYTQVIGQDDNLQGPLDRITGIYSERFYPLLVSPEVILETLKEADGDLDVNKYFKAKTAVLAVARVVATVSPNLFPQLLTAGMFPVITGPLGLFSAIKHYLALDEYGAIINDTGAEGIIGWSGINFIKSLLGIGFLGHHRISNLKELATAIEALRELDKDASLMDKYGLGLINKAESALLKKIFGASKGMQYLVINDGKDTGDLFVAGRLSAEMQLDKLFDMFIGGIHNLRGAQEGSVYILTKIPIPGAEGKYFTLSESWSGNQSLDWAYQKAAQAKASLNSNNQFTYEEKISLDIDGKPSELTVIREVTIKPGAESAQKTYDISGQLALNAPKMGEVYRQAGVIIRRADGTEEIRSGREELEKGILSFSELLKSYSSEELQFNRRSFSFVNPQTKDKISFIFGEGRALESLKLKEKEAVEAVTMQELYKNGGVIWLDAQSGESFKFLTKEEGRIRLKEALKEIDGLELMEKKAIKDNKYVYKTRVKIDGREKEVIEVLFFSRKDAQDSLQRAEIDLARANYQIEHLERIE